MNWAVALMLLAVLTVVGMSPWAIFAWYTGYIGHRRVKR